MQVAIIVRGLEGIKKLESWSAPLLLGGGAILLIWAAWKAGGLGRVLAESDELAGAALAHQGQDGGQGRQGRRKSCLDQDRRSKGESASSIDQFTRMRCGQSPAAGDAASPEGAPPRVSRPSRVWAGDDGVVLLCGRYEGVDERVRLGLATEELSIGDYVLSGGEPAAVVVIDAVVRLLPGALGSETSALFESFSEGLLDHPQYTRPPEFRGLRVPEILLGGHHAEIARWRRRRALEKTRRNRPDLFEKLELSAAELRELDAPE